MFGLKLTWHGVDRTKWMWRPIKGAAWTATTLIASLMITVVAFAAWFSSIKGSALSSTGSAQTTTFTSFVVGAGSGTHCAVATADAGKSWKIDATDLILGEICNYEITVAASGTNTLPVFVGCVVSDGSPAFSPLFTVSNQTAAGSTIIAGASKVVPFRWSIGTADAGQTAATYPLKIDFPLSAPGPCP